MSTVQHDSDLAGPLDHARSTAQEYLRQGREKAEELTFDVERLIRKQPTQALLVAAAAGFVLGAGWMRR
jgi:ElaB/YqjD/DUF883 family membrane-anchored ribosome-binding protein